MSRDHDPFGALMCYAIAFGCNTFTFLFCSLPGGLVTIATVIALAWWLG